MAQLWLPLGRPLYGVPKDEREELLNRLYTLRVLIPGARTMELQELRDLVQWQEERAEVDARKALLRRAHRPKKHSREEVIEYLKEKRVFLELRASGSRLVYLGAGTESLS